MILERTAACILGCVITLLTSCGGQHFTDGEEERRTTPESILSGCFEIIEASGMSAEDERDVLSLNPIELDTSRVGPANTRDVTSDSPTE